MLQRAKHWVNWIEQNYTRREFVWLKISISSMLGVRDFLDKFKEQFGVTHIMHGLPVLHAIFYWSKTVAMGDSPTIFQLFISWQFWPEVACWLLSWGEWPQLFTLYDSVKIEPDQFFFSTDINWQKKNNFWQNYPTKHEVYQAVTRIVILLSSSASLWIMTAVAKKSKFENVSAWY